MNAENNQLTRATRTPQVGSCIADPGPAPARGGRVVDDREGARDDREGAMDENAKT